MDKMDELALKIQYQNISFVSEVSYKNPNKALHLTAKSAVSLRYTLLLAASELGR